MLRSLTAGVGLPPYSPELSLGLQDVVKRAKRPPTGQPPEWPPCRIVSALRRYDVVACMVSRFR
jgi:hypothetical protein